MKTLLKTNDPATITYVEALLSEAGIDYLLLDEHMSIVEGSLGVIPRRILVVDEQELRARTILKEADLGHELERQG